VQFAVNPEDGRLVVIEMNPRVSRSSALASKATGFPIAKIAAKLAVGYTLDELMNDITGVTPASFEPTIDYVVTKIPRFAFEKFPGAEPLLTTAMKSVGEAMAIGRNFKESLQKALRSLETGLTGLNPPEDAPDISTEEGMADMRAALTTATPSRLLMAAHALRQGMSQEDVCGLSHFSPWFIEQLGEIIAMEAKIIEHGLPDNDEAMRGVKAMGFADARLAELLGDSEDNVRAARHKMDVRPYFRQIDTCAAEFAAGTPYLYSSYDAPSAFGGQEEAQPSDRKKAVILGGGPNRIGQGIEFDYCCCHAAYALEDAGIESIMVNCNPETVSTDYDTSDRLYFEPLTQEDVLEILSCEQKNGTLAGVIVQFGGQTPLKLSQALEKAGIPILGTDPDAIDLAEDRDRFKDLLERLELRQPDNGIARSAEEARAIAATIGFPVVIRPSYVLGGRAMEIVDNDSQLERYMREAVVVSGDSPVLIDGYLRDATELDVDVLSDGNEVFVAGILEHIEEAGVHSGDSACSMPPHSLSPKIIDELSRQAKDMAKALNVVGLMNVQFAVQGETIFVIEVNPRASRTVPFVAKVLGQPIARIAARLMAGTPLSEFNMKPQSYDHIAVKESVFPFNRFPGVDTILGPEMRSTGEVMGLDLDFATAFAKSQLGSSTVLPDGGTAFISVREGDKQRAIAPAQRLTQLGFKLIATGGTAAFLAQNGIDVEPVNKVAEGRPHIVDAIKNGDVQLVVNTTEGEKSLADSKSIRRTTLEMKIPYYTTLAGAEAAVAAIKALDENELSVTSLQDYAARL
jgi:carbamoyl-phosphate synthase large subunit